MRNLSHIIFPAALMLAATIGAFALGRGSIRPMTVPSPAEVRDTVKYPLNGYRLRRNAGQVQEISIPDSLRFADRGDSGTDTLFVADTMPHLTARDTIKAPDSLKYTDPFRYRYYVALLDSLTHVQTRDSLKKSILSHLEAGDTLLARADSLDWHRLDSLYAADSTFAARLRFEQWYASLSPAERRKYEKDLKDRAMMARSDSLRKVKEAEKAVRDSIIENTPRILDSYSIPDSMQYRRIISWTVDQDFHRMEVSEPDTTYNYHFHDMPFRRRDVNATWLGMAGSPVQYYNVQLREGSSDVDFYKSHEAWSYSTSTLPHYNSKTPHTELAYFGTLFSTRSKESDNLHLFTTQNITPELNFAILYERYGGEGIIAREQTVNNNFVVQTNYLGKKYMMHSGYIRNVVKRQENGGIADNFFIRDTTVDARDVPVNLSNASSKVTRHTVFLDQQLRIPFTFIERMRERKDSSYRTMSDSTSAAGGSKDITTAFVGHSSEFSAYARTYSDELRSAAEKRFYGEVFNLGDKSADSLRMAVLDNKFFIRLQPWSADAVVSRLDIGIGDCLKNYYSRTVDPEYAEGNVVQNSTYLYAGAEGRFRDMFVWDAKARTVFAGADAGDMSVKARAGFRFYPFRRHRKSPLSINAIFETSLKNPNYYQQHILLNHYSWDNDFGKTLTTGIRGEFDIPAWKLNATAGYTMLSNNIYYDSGSIIRQNTEPMSVISATLSKDFTLGPVHLDNRALMQWSSNQEVVPVPLAALNLRYYLQFVAQWDESHTRKILEMQAGVNVFFNTKWNSPAWNPNAGVFYNQTENLYNNGPYFDVFLNMQWKRCCIFIKYQNAGMGWPMKKMDYFSADHFTVTESGMNGLKIGIFWPFYTEPNIHGHKH